MRAERAEVGGSEVVVADQLELVILRLVRPHAATGRLTGTLTGRPGMSARWRPLLRVSNDFISGLRVRAMSCRVLAHDDPPLPAVCRAGAVYLPAPTGP